MQDLIQTRSNTGLELMASTPLKDSFISWAVAVPGVGLALCDEQNDKLIFWTGDGNFTAVDLAPLTVPVGATYLDGKVYVACFGKWPIPEGDSGLVVVDVASRKVERTFVYSGEEELNSSRMHLHNVYVFEWNCQPEIFVAVLGNPWMTPPIAGHALVRFNRSSGSFNYWTTKAYLNIRSAVQQNQKVFFAVTQEPAGQSSQLIRLEKYGDELLQVAAARLPGRNGGDGGADVILAGQKDSVFCTDRHNGFGRLYHYRYDAGSFTLTSSHTTGNHSRYTTILANGDVVVCDRSDGALTSFLGLAKHPAQAVESITVKAMPGVSFLFQGTESKEGAWNSPECHEQAVPVEVRHDVHVALPSAGFVKLNALAHIPGTSFSVLATGIGLIPSVTALVLAIGCSVGIARHRRARPSSSQRILEDDNGNEVPCCLD